MSAEFNYFVNKVDRQMDYVERNSLRRLREKEQAEKLKEDYIPAEPDPFEKDKSFAGAIGVFHRQPQKSLSSNGIRKLV